MRLMVQAVPRLPTFLPLPRLAWLGALLAAGGSGGWPAAAAEAWRLPPIDGEISGEFAFRPDEAGPVARWTLTVRTDATRERRAQFKVEGDGARVTGEAQLDPGGEGTWRLTAAEIDLGRWFAAVAAQLGEDLADMSFQGMLVASGAGTLRDGVVGGRAQFSLREGRIEIPARKLQLEGVAVSVEIEEVGARRSARSQVLSWQSGHYDVLALGRGQVVFALEGDELRVEEAKVAVLGGEVTAGAFAVSVAKPEFSVTARMLGVDIAELKDFVPPVLSSARGRLDGQVIIMRTSSGIEIGPGRLSLREGETAELRLAPTPGLLSASLPAAVIKHYPGLGKIELGEVPLRANLLEVTFDPAGDAEGRTASVHVAGGPVDPDLRAPIDLSVNVRGPLEALMKFGTDSRLRFGGSK